MKLLEKSLETNFGILVDGCVEVDFNGFKKAIDLAGGVDVELTNAEAKYLNEHRWENELGKVFAAGVNHMNGEQALAYSRIRAIDSDFGRTQRQQNVIGALLNKAKGMSLGDMDRLLRAILPCLTTNMTNSQILGLAADILPMVGQLQTTKLQIPAPGTYQDVYIRGMAVLLPNFDQNRLILKDCMKTN
jgi:anionic cell wall polymer biosynthesis LytR-Cps2A-Psr (LCP) family protein